MDGIWMLVSTDFKRMNFLQNVHNEIIKDFGIGMTAINKNYLEGYNFRAHCSVL